MKQNEIIRTFGSHTHTYGGPTVTQGQRGRIALLEDASGFRAYKYGRMGEVTEEHRTFVLPNESHPYSFKMKYTYDSWNRIQNITYPDKEVVHYYYNTGGMLRRVQGEKRYNIDTLVPFFPHDTFPRFLHNVGDHTADIAHNDDIVDGGDRSLYAYYYYNYIDSIHYNEFELKSGQWYGNGTYTNYTYDILQRLSHLAAYNSENSAMQNITYTYDKASNITQIKNNALPCNTLGTPYTYNYQYDSLYRLVNSSGISIYGGTIVVGVNLDMSYMADGRITQKKWNGKTRLNGVVQSFNNNYRYTYNTSQPHTAHSVDGETFEWDANGNMTEYENAQLWWDEENRLRRYSHKMNLTVSFYQYDASGERFYKNTGFYTAMLVNGHTASIPYYNTPTLYVSPYVVANHNGYTKHYFIENERFASRIGDGAFSDINTHTVSNTLLTEKQTKVNDAAPDSIQPNKLSNLLSLPSHWSTHHTTYWQHSDHLGSASWVTDTNGLGYQHLLYMPWGEPLFDQRVVNNTYENRYTFSGKERDEETGFSYFGARYYNSDLSIWLSVDPMSDKYPSLSPYVYCADNPVKLVDVDGRKITPLYDTYGSSLVRMIMD